MLLHGANAGLVRERADALARAVVPDLKDAFRITELSGETLKRDPARLADEAAAISMFGGRRVVRVRDAADALAQLFETFLGSDSGDTLVVIEAGELSKASNLRKLFEGARNAAGIECADDSASDTARLIEESLAAQGWKITPEAQAYLADALVKVTDAAGRTVLETRADGPWLYVNLRQGDYRVLVTYKSESRQQATRIHANDRHEMFFYFDEAVERLPKGEKG